MYVFLKDGHTYTYTLVHTENLALELMYKKLVPTKYLQGGKLSG